MKHLLATLILVATLSGCLVDTEPVNPYGLKDERNGGLGLWCRTTKQVVTEYVDSTSTCGDGSAPRLAKIEWLSTNGTCNANKVSDVVGGMSGIRRYFGCVKNQAVEGL